MPTLQPVDRRPEEVAKAVGGSYCRLQMQLNPAHPNHRISCRSVQCIKRPMRFASAGSAVD